MAHDIRRTVTTTWAPEEVYAYMLDFTSAEEWDAGTVTCTLVSGDGGVGTTYQNVSQFRGNETTLEYVTESADESAGTHRFVIVGKNKTVTSRDTITIVPGDGGGSSVDYRAEMTFHGFAALASPFLTKPLQKLGDDTAKQLKETLDARAAAR